MIQPFSRISSSINYSSIQEFLKQAKHLCQSTSFQEFREEIEKWENGTNSPLSFLLSGRDEDNKNVPFFAYCFAGQDNILKTEYILKEVGKGTILNWLEMINPLTGKSFRKTLELYPDLVNVFEKQGFVFTLLEGTGIKHGTFDWNGFHVLNAGFFYEDMKLTLEELKPSIEKIKKTGFGKIIYGNLIFVGSPMKGQVFNVYQKKYRDIDAGAYYSIEEDNIVIKSRFGAKQSVHAKSLVHELGHRHYYKFLSSSQRQQWEAHFKNRGIYVREEEIEEINRLFASCTPDLENPINPSKPFKDWSKTNWTKFTVKLRGSSELVRAVFDFICISHAIFKGNKDKNIKTLRREFFNYFIEKEALGGLEWCSKHYSAFLQAMSRYELNEEAVRFSRDFYPGEEKLKEAERIYGDGRFAFVQEALNFCKDQLSKWERNLDYYKGQTIKIPYSSSEYGQENPSEDYAEAFEHFINNKEMPVDIYKEFVRVNNIRIARKAKWVEEDGEDISEEDAEESIHIGFSKKEYPLAPEWEWYGEADYRKRGGKLVWMPPEEFLSRAKPLVINEVSRDNIEDLKELMLSGKPLDPLVIYDNDKSETRNTDGRHRANAAKELGIKKVPVIDYTLSEKK